MNYIQLMSFQRAHVTDEIVVFLQAFVNQSINNPLKVFLKKYYERMGNGLTFIFVSSKCIITHGFNIYMRGSVVSSKLGVVIRSHSLPSHNNGTTVGAIGGSVFCPCTPQHDDCRSGIKLSIRGRPALPTEQTPK